MRQITFRIKEEDYEEIEKLAYINRIPMAEQLKRLCLAGMKDAIIKRREEDDRSRRKEHDADDGGSA